MQTKLTQRIYVTRHQGLNEYIAVLQVQQISNPQLVNVSRNYRHISKMISDETRYNRERSCPGEGIYTSNGSIFIGNYLQHQGTTIFLET